MRIVSWNVNGYRAVWKKGFSEWLAGSGADIVCVQETKAWPEQLSVEQRNPLGFTGHFAQAEKKGYSGVATFSREAPDRVRVGFGDAPEFDREGRVLITEHLDGELVLANIYFPNGKRNRERVDYKLRFYDKTLEVFGRMRDEGRKVIVCGDYNTAHRPIDLARPKANETTSGFLPEEREWIDRWIDAGFIDIFREYNAEPEQYTWWDMITRARERNVGWRIDYHFVSDTLADAATGAAIRADVMGSDHCPVVVDLDEERV